jgi:uncharacterized membrane protein YgcG
MATPTRTTTGRARPPFKVVAVGSLAAFAVIFGGETIRLHQGHDPALQTTDAGSTAATQSSSPSSAFSEPAFDGGGSSSGSGGSSLPTTQSS